MRAAGPIVDPVPCSGCGKLLDPLRAGHVAVFDLALHYFCNRTTCRETFLAPFADALPVKPATGLNGGTFLDRPRPPRSSSRTLAETSPPPERAEWSRSTGDGGGRSGGLAAIGAGPLRNALPSFVPEDVLPQPLRIDDDRAFVEPIGRTILHDAPPRAESDGRDAGALLLFIAIVAGLLAILLGIATTGGRLVLIARTMLAGVGGAMLVLRALTTPRDASDPEPIAVLAAPAISVVIALASVFASSRLVASEAASLAGTIAMTAALSAWLLEAARRSVIAERRWCHASLDAPVRRVTGPATTESDDDQSARPGESIIVEPGEDVPVDMIVTGDEVEILPWLGATTPVRRVRGEPVVAGARLLRGRLEGTCTWSGYDRTFARLVLDPRRRVDALTPVARAPRSLAERWAGAAALVAGILVFVITRSVVDAAMVAVATLAGLSNSTLATLSSVHVARGVLLAQRRGIGYRSADAWDRAARATVALFCARGTLLLGEPEVAEIEALASSIEVPELLSLAAGAARADGAPVAHAILRCAKARQVKPDAVRNPTVVPGAGVVAVTSAGADLVVGTRTLLIEQRISIASVEWRMSELEGQGRSVVLVGLSGRLIGMIALQDGIRPGARAAVQHLLDAQIEPILMSGDSRETCEAIGRSLDIEHIRPEITADDCATEVKRVSENGVSVAVFGHPGLDDGALGAAQVAVALGAAGTADADQEVVLASDDLRDAALSLALARRTRTLARVAFGLAALPPALGAAVVAFGVLPPAFVPIAGLIGAGMGVLHGRLQRTG